MRPQYKQSAHGLLATPRLCLVTIFNFIFNSIWWKTCLSKAKKFEQKYWEWKTKLIKKIEQLKVWISIEVKRDLCPDSDLLIAYFTFPYFLITQFF